MYCYFQLPEDSVLVTQGIGVLIDAVILTNK